MSSCSALFSKAFLRTVVRFGAISYLAPSLGLDPSSLLAHARSSIFAIPAKIVVRCRVHSLGIRSALVHPLLCSLRYAPGGWVKQKKTKQKQYLFNPSHLHSTAGEREKNQNRKAVIASAAKQSHIQVNLPLRDCFVVTLLAMTTKIIPLFSKEGSGEIILKT